MPVSGDLSSWVTSCMKSVFSRSRARSRALASSRLVLRSKSTATFSPSERPMVEARKDDTKNVRTRKKYSAPAVPSER